MSYQLQGETFRGRSGSPQAGKLLPTTSWHFADASSRKETAVLGQDWWHHNTLLVSVPERSQPRFWPWTAAVRNTVTRREKTPGFKHNFPFYPPSQKSAKKVHYWHHGQETAEPKGLLQTLPSHRGATVTQNTSVQPRQAPSQGNGLSLWWSLRMNLYDRVETNQQSTAVPSLPALFSSLELGETRGCPPQRYQNEVWVELQQNLKYHLAGWGPAHISYLSSWDGPGTSLRCTTGQAA